MTATPVRRVLRVGAIPMAAALAVVAAISPALAARSSIPAGQVLRVETGQAHVTVFGNLTVTEPTAAGFATVYPCNAPRPWASNINYTAGQTVANFTAVRTDARGGFCVFTTAPAQFVFDMVASTPGQIVDTPSRKYDSRERHDADHKPIAHEVVQIPTDSPNSTVFGNLTVTNPAGAGYATAYPCDSEPPEASNLNFVAGQTVASFIGVRTNAHGKFCVVSNTSADFVFDKVGATQKFLTERPLRLIDTRQTIQAVPAGQIVHIATGSPSATVMGTLTITEPAGSGYATAFSCDRPRPWASNINFTAGQTVANFVTVRTDATGDFCVFTSQSAQIIFDKVSAGQQETPATDPDRKIDSRDDDWQTETEFEQVHGTEAEFEADLEHTQPHQ